MSPLRGVNTIQIDTFDYVQYQRMSSQQTLQTGLYVVATPIGNLQDLSPRASAVLAAAQLIAAEDTRVSGRLVRSAGGAGRLLSLTEHNVEQRIPAIIEAARENVVALVSDAGTPCLADPGARLVDAVHRAGVLVFAIPGPSAVAAALSVSGFDGSDAHFIGFPPRSRPQRIERFRETARNARTLVFFESPGRLSAALIDLAEALHNPEVAVCREMTKLHEEIVRGRASELAERFATTLGECAVVVRCPEAAAPQADAAEVTEYLAEMHRAGARRAAAAAEAARRFGIPRSRAYDLWPEGER